MKSERAEQLELILKSHPEGLRKSEIARRIGVHRSTIGRYIEELKLHNNVLDDNNLIKIVPDKSKDDQLSLSLYESIALKMSAELLMKNSQTQNPHLISALRKIGLNMKDYAPKASAEIMHIAEEVEKSATNSSKESGPVLEVLIDAWTSGRMVKIIHSQNGNEEETELAPYFIGFIERENGRNPITVTGRLRHTTEVITIDIATIENVYILEETYTIPDNLKAFNKRDIPHRVSDVIDTIPLVLDVRQKSALNSFRSLAHSEITVDKKADGLYRCSFDAENSIELILRIIQCFDSVEIIGPENFKVKFVAILKQILSLYN